LKLRRLGLLGCAGVLSSCYLFDSGVEWRGGPYTLLWIDSPDNTSICRDEGDGHCGGRIEASVFAAGWDGRYLVAKQHPGNDRRTTHYFIIDAQHDTRLADPATYITGPLTAGEFQRKSKDLKLPQFSKVLESLE